jgi:hypothetical protein
MVYMAIRPRYINAVPDAGLGVPVSFGAGKKRSCSKAAYTSAT